MDSTNFPANVKTIEGAARAYRALYRQCKKDLAGGMSFGIDWPTLRATFPERAAIMQALSKAIADNSLPYARSVSWRLYWGPTGEAIGIVSARSAKAARRKAPAKYRKYKGEIGALLAK